MTLYCPSCTSGFESIQMEETYSGSRYSFYRCPKCLRVRKVTSSAFGMDEIEDVSAQEAQKIAKSGDKKAAAVLVGLGLLGLGLLASLADKDKE